MKTVDPLALLNFYVSQGYTVTYVDEDLTRRCLAQGIIKLEGFEDTARKKARFVRTYSLSAYSSEHTDITIFVNPPNGNEVDEYRAYKELLWQSPVNVTISV